MSKPMHIRGVPEEVARRFKAEAAGAGMTAAEYLNALLMRGDRK